jgi:hypothetical protein
MWKEFDELGSFWSEIWTPKRTSAGLRSQEHQSHLCIAQHCFPTQLKDLVILMLLLSPTV